MSGPSSACGSGPGATTSGLIRDPNRLAFERLLSARRNPRLRPVEPALHPPPFAELLLDGLQQRAHAHRIRAARMEAAARRRGDQDPLPHPAGELVRVLAEASRRDAHPAERLERAAADLRVSQT